MDKHPGIQQDEWLERQLNRYYTAAGRSHRTLNAFVTAVIWLCLLAVPLAFTLTQGLKAGLLFGGLFCTAMFINTALTNLSNALVGRVLGGAYDLFWRLFFIIGGAVSFTLFYLL